MAFLYLGHLCQAIFREMILHLFCIASAFLCLLSDPFHIPDSHTYIHFVQQTKGTLCRQYWGVSEKVPYTNREVFISSRCLGFHKVRMWKSGRQRFLKIYSTVIKPRHTFWKAKVFLRLAYVRIIAASYPLPSLPPSAPPLVSFTPSQGDDFFSHIYDRA